MKNSIRKFALLGSCIAFLSAPAASQTATEDTQDTAKPADTVSPYGVSYHTGSFTYSVPLFTIGHGDWPNQITVSLNYDSSGSRNPNDPWTLSIERRFSGAYARYETGFQGDPLDEFFQYSLSASVGNRSHTFFLGGPDYDPSNFESVSLDGASIDFVPDNPAINNQFSYQDGEFRILGSDGTKIEFRGRVGGGDPAYNFTAPELTLPNGQVVKYSAPNFWNGAASLNYTSNGLVVRTYGNQICAFNAAYVDVDTINSCASAPLVATLTTANLPGGSHTERQITSVTRPDGGTFTFQYQQYQTSSWHPSGISGGTRTRNHLSCVKEPGQSTCAVQNTYDPCDGSGFVFVNPDFFGPGSYSPYDSEWTGSRDRVSSQTLADGRTISYAYTGGTVGPYTNGPCDDVRTVTMTESGATTRTELSPRINEKSSSPGPDLVVDPLGRETRYSWTGANSAAENIRQHDKVSSVEVPDGRIIQYTYDTRGNRTETRAKARPGSGQTDIVTTASFPSSCTNQFTCNKPTSTTDAEGNVTSFTYEAAHGGLRSVIGPAVDGVSPATRFYYVQREAWLRSGSGYAKTGDPIWLLSEERTCRTSTLNVSAGTCAAGANDLIRTVYDYGPDSGPNNLWLRGIAVIGGGETLRTCYSYDQLGRRISETRPKANLASCP